CQQYNDMVLTF
nr:immunoglobulin light chain junction region [Macaca mulatta]MOX53706.1 immunoglobulin light chain junction region [Macaca mulatta]